MASTACRLGPALARRRPHAHGAQPAPQPLHEPQPLPDETTPQLDALLPRRRQLLDMLVAARHRVALAHPAGRDGLAGPIDDLQGLIHATDAEVATTIRTSPTGREKDDLRQSAPGIGPVLSATLQAALPE